MDTIKAIRARRSIKHYDPEFIIPPEDEKELLDLARQSPTSFNMQNWRFVNVKDKDLRMKIRKAAWGQAQVSEASMLLILCADLKAHKQNPARYWADAPIEAQEVLVPMITPFYEAQPEKQRDEAMRSIGIAAQTFMLAAKAMGYDSCPMIGFDADKVAELIKLPENHVTGMIITIGKAVKPAWPKPGYLPDEEVIFTDTF
ncbi:MAG: nitroreductase family protein [Alphaproteobacteria bacterium]